VAEQRKAKAYAKLWNMDAARAKLIFFAIELSGCLAEAQGLCKVRDRKGSNPSTKVSPSVSKSTEHMMKPRLYGGLGLGVEEVRGLG
jgi:hypothetical protein